MSEEKESPVLETIEEEKEKVEQNSETSPQEDLGEDLTEQSSATKSQKKGKNPNRVKAAHKLAAKRQLLKEESVRKRAQDEMTKPSTWVMMGVVLTSIGFLGLCFSPLFPEKQTEKQIPREQEKQIPPMSKSYFG